ncbi:MAG: AlpA family phage regulatory protein [Betaproteobacteria bacterium]|nr:AlpA family phage regulatory protein [Betaproteobacteria bacterium]
MSTSQDPFAHMQMLTMKRVSELTTYTIQHLYRLIAAGKFPKPVRLGLNRIGFRRSDIELWLEDKAAGRPYSPRRPGDDGEARL